MLWRDEWKWRKSLCDVGWWGGGERRSLCPPLPPSLRLSVRWFEGSFLFTLVFLVGFLFLFLISPVCSCHVFSSPPWCHYYCILIPSYAFSSSPIVIIHSSLLIFSSLPSSFFLVSLYLPFTFLLFFSHILLLFPTLVTETQSPMCSVVVMTIYPN